MTPPRADHHPEARRRDLTPERKADIDRAWQTTIAHAAADLAAVTAKAITAYQAQVSNATVAYEKAIDTANSIWTAIADPAQQAYDAQLTLAEDAVQRILTPARSNYTAAAARAKQDWDDVYNLALRAWEDERNAADRVRDASLRSEAH